LSKAAIVDRADDRHQRENGDRTIAGWHRLGKRWDCQALAEACQVLAVPVLWRRRRLVGLQRGKRGQPGIKSGRVWQQVVPRLKVPLALMVLRQGALECRQLL